MAMKSRPPASPLRSHPTPTATATTSITRSCSACLPRECELLYPKLEFMRLKTHHVLHEPGDTLKSAYFCNSGLVSILSVLPDGKSVEVGLVGKEGFIGLPLVAGFRTAPTRAIVQIEGSVFRVDGETLTGSSPAVPHTGAAVTAVFPGHGHAGHTDCRLQSSA